MQGLRHHSTSLVPQHRPSSIKITMELCQPATDKKSAFNRKPPLVARIFLWGCLSWERLSFLSSSVRCPVTHYTARIKLSVLPCV